MTGVVDGDDRGHQRGVVTQVADVAARLARLETQFAEIQRLAQLGSWEWDIVANVVTWSDELYRIYGVAPGAFEATYDAFLSRIHPDDRDMVNDTVQRAYAERASYAFDHRFVRPDGSVGWLHGRGNVLADEQGEPLRLHGVAIDITVRKRSEQFLREFIANASHELRTPAAAISQAAFVLANDTLTPGDRAAAMDALTRQAERLRGLSTNLLDLAALDEGARSVMLVPVALGEHVRNAAAVSPQADDATLTIDIDAALAVRADPTELERVFVNLLANAHEHGGPNVSVTARRQAEEVMVDVGDDGPGVPDDYLQDMFAPFAKRRTTGQGSGLGLAIVDQLMAAFGGTISYHHAEPHGAVFTLRFAVAHGDDPDHRG
ncbi:MAG: PAS domain-containing sensor histidine kinase [Chthoniobacterales bacterium]|nr:PAS domain-containing sensor histidine kinase [Chthoniobacterales bacterium]